jgi:predicted nucleic acid-binding protein
MAYLLDSNVFIQAKNLHYGFDFCPAFWAWIDAQQEDGNVYSIEKVRDELIGGDDELAEWAKARGDDFFLPPDNDTLPSLATIASWAGSGHYEASAASQFLQVADYYLVAHAHAQGFDVVTHEVNSNSIRKIKIPDACIAHNVTAVNPFQMLRREKARFVLSERR